MGNDFSAAEVYRAKQAKEKAEREAGHKLALARAHHEVAIQAIRLEAAREAQKKCDAARDKAAEAERKVAAEAIAREKARRETAEKEAAKQAEAVRVATEREKQEMLARTEREAERREAAEAEAKRVAQEAARQAEQARKERARERKEMLEREREAQQKAEEARKEAARQAERARVAKANTRKELLESRRSHDEHLKEKNEEFANMRAAMTALQLDIASEEKEIAGFRVERADKDARLVVIVGHTGDGKSTFCNRLCGDESDYGDEGEFKASDEMASCTQGFQKKRVVIDKIPIVFVDTPGCSDSFGKDRLHANNLCKFLRGCGGINAFILVNNATNVRLDQTVQAMLDMYFDMFGKVFFENLIVVATKVDYNNKQFIKNKTASKLQNNICKRFEVDCEPSVLPIGLDNYKDGVIEFANLIPKQKFECEKIRSPIEDLKMEEAKVRSCLAALQLVIEGIEAKISEIDCRLTAL